MAAKRPAGADFFAPASQKQAKMLPVWRVTKQTLDRVQSVAIVRVDKDSPASERIAAFDMDGTIVRTKSGSSFPTGPSDWKVLNDRVCETLRKLHSSGYKICIFSNQNGIKGALEGKRATTAKGYCDAFLREAGVPAMAVLAPQQDGFRKPLPGMWNLVMDSHNGGVKPDLSNSFFVGDAAGRDGDHSDADMGFAESVGIRFYTPEEAFSESWEVLAKLPAEGAAAAAAVAAAGAPAAPAEVVAVAVEAAAAAVATTTTATEEVVAVEVAAVAVAAAVGGGAENA